MHDVIISFMCVVEYCCTISLKVYLIYSLVYVLRCFPLAHNTNTIISNGPVYALSDPRAIANYYYTVVTRFSNHNHFIQQ